MERLKIYVLHVKEGYADRARHIEQMMARLGLSFEWVLDGDIADLTPERVARWFAQGCPLRPAEKSCAMKHLLACERIVESGADGAVVLEDDIVLRSNFEETVLRSLRELPLEASIVNYEDSRLRFVEHSRRRKGQLLYAGDRDRFTGCLYLNRAGAEAVLHAASTGGIDRPIDHYHRHLLETGQVKYWWCEPCVATQGSFNGLFSSSVASARGKAAVWRLKRAWRRLLYRFR